MRKFATFICLLCIIGLAVGQNRTISGTVTDASSGETLIGATVVDLLSGKGTVTNAYGRYSLTLRADTAELRVSFVGYQSQERRLSLLRSVEIDWQLASSLQLDEVTIVAERTGDTRSSQISALEMPVEKIKSVPVMFGEADIIKALQLMPGVQSGSEGNSGMYVRGGGPDENLFLLDGVPLYNVSHMGGFISAFNTDAVKNVTLYKGSFPARFGGRLSSVLDVTQNNGNDKALHGNASVGLISAKVSLEGPIKKERTTFSLSARRTYAELLLIPAMMAIDKATSKQEETPDIAEVQNANYDAGYYFYDLNAKLTHKLTDKSRLYGSFYMGRDFLHGRVNTVTSLDEPATLGFSNGWGNMMGSLRWNYVLGPKLFMNASASYTEYTNDIIGTIERGGGTSGTYASTIEGDYSSGIRDLTLRLDFDYVPLPEHNIKFGTFYTQHWFMPEVVSGSVDYFDSVQMNEPFRQETVMPSETLPAGEMAFFAEDDWALTDALKINFGLHISAFHVQDTTYFAPQPRLSGRWMLSDDLSVKLGYAYMTQYVHLLSTSSISLPTDLWVPVTQKVAPMRAHQVAGGLFYSRSGIADFSIEAYYKRMSNLIEYRDGASFFGSSEHWENLVYAGDGWSYGIEFLVQREIGNLTGWLAYTWSRTEHLFDREKQVINNGQPFPAKYDRRHDISVVLSYKFSPTVDVSATWVFSSGNAVTLSTQRYPAAGEDPDDYSGSNSGQLPVFEGRNNYRMPNYHRLDIGANFHRTFAHSRRTINVSIYNVYNRKNPYLIYQKAADPGSLYPYNLVQLSLFPIIPSASYTLYF